MTDMRYASAIDLSAAFARRQVSPVEVLEATLALARRVQADLNPFCLFDDAAARRAARDSEQRWLAGQPLSALDGVPVAVKDNQAVAGQTCNFGSRALESPRPMAQDAPHVARLRDAGAVFYARTTMPDLAWKAVNDSPRTGVTRNPWNPALTPGGSSGGSAVAVATGCCPIGLGSDGGGSVRIPAAFTGIYGLKPTTGRIPGIAESPDITAIGPLTRTVSDAALAMSIMCRPDAADPIASALYVPDFVAEAARGVAGLRIAVTRRLGRAEAGDDQVALLDAAAEALAASGAQVAYADPPPFDIRRDYVTVCEAAFAGVVATMPPERQALLDPQLLATAKRGMMASAATERQAQIARIRLIRQFVQFFSSFDLMLAPCVPIAPFAAGVSVNTPDQTRYPEWYDWTPYTWVFNAARMPAASCPWGLDAAGLPRAVQLASLHFREDLILRASRVLEAAMPYPRLADTSPSLNSPA